MFNLRGSWQRQMANDLLSGLHVPATLFLSGRAKSYRQRYQSSFHKVVEALRQAGYNVSLTPGPKGGTTTDAAYWSVG